MSTTYAPGAHLRRPHVNPCLVALLGLALALVSVLLIGDARSAGRSSGLIAFARADGIYAMHADGSDIRSLRRGGAAAAAFDLAWSPDGRRLAFARSNAIWVMNGDGSHLARLVAVGDASGKAPGSLASPTWAPDGRRIAFTAGHRRDRDIWLVNADGSNLRRLVWTHGRGRDYDEVEVDWNPSGARLAFSGASWATQIAVINTNGSNLRTWWGGNCGGVWCAMPDWSPDGRRIAFTDGRGISVIHVDNEDGLVRLTRNNAADSEPAWSPDGERIAFVRSDGLVKRDRPQALLQDSSSEIYEMNADGTGVKSLTHNRVAEASPAWRPLGREER